MNVRAVPRPRLDNKIIIMYGLIGKRRILTYIFGVWAQKLDLADLTRKWCNGNTWGFDLHDMGSSPFFLRSRGDFNLHNSLYQSGPWAFGHSSLVTVGVVSLLVQWAGQCVIELGLVSGAGSFFIRGVLIDHIGIGGRMRELIRIVWRVGQLLL